MWLTAQPQISRNLTTGRGDVKRISTRLVRFLLLFVLSSIIHLPYQPCQFLVIPCVDSIDYHWRGAPRMLVGIKLLLESRGYIRRTECLLLKNRSDRQEAHHNAYRPLH